VHRKNAGVAEVLEKLSVGFDKYIRILSHMRGEYLDLMKRLSQGEVYHLERSVDEHAQQELLRLKQDELLECYSAWKSTPDAQTTEDLQRVVVEIQQLNPSFKSSFRSAEALGRRARSMTPPLEDGGVGRFVAGCGRRQRPLQSSWRSRLRERASLPADARPATHSSAHIWS